MSIKYPTHTPHHGRNVRRLRELIDLRQVILADALDISQQTMSKLERQEEIDEPTLAKIAKALNIPVAAIKNLTDETATNMISNTFEDFKDNASANGNANSNNGEHPFFGGNQYNENTAETLAELYDKLANEKENRISALEKMMAEMKAEIEKNRKDE